MNHNGTIAISSSILIASDSVASVLAGAVLGFIGLFCWIPAVAALQRAARAQPPATAESPPEATGPAGSN